MFVFLWVFFIHELMAGPLALRTINWELYFTYGKGTWGGGAYYLGGAGCMRGNTVNI